MECSDRHGFLGQTALSAVHADAGDDTSNRMNQSLHVSNQRLGGSFGDDRFFLICSISCLSCCRSTSKWPRSGSGSRWASSPRRMGAAAVGSTVNVSCPIRCKRLFFQFTD